MFCRPASSRAHVTLIQSFSFNFKSLVDFRNPHWVHWKSPALLFSSPRLSPLLSFFFFIPPFIFYVISLFLPLISSRHNLRVVCGSYHSVAPSACRSIRPSARFLFRRHSWCFLGGFFCLSGTVSMTDQSFVVLVKIPADLTGENTNPWCMNDVFARCGFDIFFLDVKSDLQFWDFFYWIRPPNICFFIGNGRQETVKEWGEEYKRRGKEERSAQRKKRKRHRWGFLKRRAQVILHSELVMCFKDVFKGEDGLYDGVYCPSRKISPG